MVTAVVTTGGADATPLAGLLLGSIGEGGEIGSVPIGREDAEPPEDSRRRGNAEVLVFDDAADR